jgi:hypothetical protein
MMWHRRVFQCPPTGTRKPAGSPAPKGLHILDRYLAVASPSLSGLVARMTSLTSPPDHPLHQFLDVQVVGPHGHGGDDPWSTW